MIDVSDADEETRLLASPPPSRRAPYANIFNDLTYSDDEDDADEEEWDGELGVSGSISSPDTAALLDEIQNAMFPVQAQTSQLQPHLMHPLARNESVNSSEGGDEGSYLAYSISSTVVDDDNGSRQTDAARTSPASPGNSYGALALDGTSSFETFKTKNRQSAVIFRPPSSVFDHSPERASRSNANTQYASQYTTQNQQHQRTATSPLGLQPKPSKRIENLHPNQSVFAMPQSTNSNCPQSYNGSSGTNNIDTNNGGYRPITPIPFTSTESPVTSATATDGTNDSPSATSNSNLKEGGSEPEKERITKILSEEATKRLRRHRRLKRLKKAAEAREAAVQKIRGTEQGTRCNDALFAFIFLCQFLLVAMSAFAFGPGALRDKIYGSLMHGMNDNNEDGDEGETVVDYDPFAALHSDDIVILENPRQYGSERRGMNVGEVVQEEVLDTVEGISHIDYVNVIQLVCILSGYASVCSLLALGFMVMLSKNLLYATLIFTIGVSVVWTLLGLVFSPYWIIPITGAVAVILSTAYTVVVWDRISFAATNFSVALKGMRSTLDIPFVGICVLAMSFLWTILWFCAFIGTFDFINDEEELSNNWMSVIVVFFLFSYYWTFQVIKGISQTTVASIIGKWWAMSEEDPLPLCSSVLHSTLTLNIIRSFGSICLGSLIVGPCILFTRFTYFHRLAKSKLYQFRISYYKPSTGEPDGKCDCGCLDNVHCSPYYNDSVISRNVNQWSYTYIGLYGYKFWESGSRASQLFEARGWTNVISDDLIMTVMSMSSMIISGSTACLGLIVEEVDGYSFTSLNKPITTAFFIGAFVGYFLSSAFLSIVEGSVSAILVCYASAPVEFHANHHTLSDEMKKVWRIFWLLKSSSGSAKPSI